MIDYRAEFGLINKQVEGFDIESYMSKSQTQGVDHHNENGEMVIDAWDFYRSAEDDARSGYEFHLRYLLASKDKRYREVGFNILKHYMKVWGRLPECYMLATSEVPAEFVSRNEGPHSKGEVGSELQIQANILEQRMAAIQFSVERLREDMASAATEASTRDTWDDLKNDWLLPPLDYENFIRRVARGSKNTAANIKSWFKQKKKRLAFRPSKEASMLLGVDESSGSTGLSSLDIKSGKRSASW